MISLSFWSEIIFSELFWKIHIKCKLFQPSTLLATWEIKLKYFHDFRKSVSNVFFIIKQVTFIIKWTVHNLHLLYQKNFVYRLFFVLINIVYLITIRFLKLFPPKCYSSTIYLIFHQPWYFLINLLNFVSIICRITNYITSIIV